MDLSKQILSDVIVFSKYARYIPELKRRETWEEIVTRNMNMHLKRYPDLADEIKENYKLVYDKKVLPSMRSMQFGGKPIEINPARVFNCCALPVDDYFVFAEIMFLLMSGCGIGISVQYHHVEKLPEILKPSKRKRRHLIADSVEGWADAIKVLMKAYFFHLSEPVFDFSAIRPKGAHLLTSGGKAPGPQFLKDCIHNIRKILDAKETGSCLKSIEVFDIVCFICDAVLSGGIRRSSCLCMFSFDDEEMIHAKSGNWQQENPQRARSNNSAVILRHRIKKKDFLDLWEKIKNSRSGEPSFMFSNNSEYLRNACAEASLRGNTFCNLTEINGSNIETQEDFNQRAKAASFIGTLQANFTDFHYIRDVWKKNTEKDALIGVGITGIANKNFLCLNFKEVANVVVEENKRVAKFIGINTAARTCLVKPSGTASLVLSCSSGVHAWYAPYYIRRIRLLKNEAIYLYLKEIIPELIEDDFFNPIEQAVISLPIAAPKDAIYSSESCMDFLERIKKINEEWIQPGHVLGDNMHSISATVYLREEDWTDIANCIWKEKEKYNALSFLPIDNNIYKQMPFEECSKYIYDKMYSSLKKIDLTKIKETEDNTKQKEVLACHGNNCEVV